MNKLQITNVIRSRYATLVAGPQSLPTAYPNAAFTRPDAATKWSRLTILFGQSLQASIGAPTSRVFRTPGVAVAEIFTPIEVGDSQSLTLATAVETAFRGITVGGVVFQAPSIINVGVVGSDWKVNVEIPFYADDIG